MAPKRTRSGVAYNDAGTSRAPAAGNVVPSTTHVEDIEQVGQIYLSMHCKLHFHMHT